MGSMCHVSPNAENELTELYRPLLEHPKLKKGEFVLLAVYTVRLKAAGLVA